MMDADYLPRKRSIAAVWARRVALFSAVLLLVAASAHRYRLLDTPGLEAVLAVVAALAVAAGLLAVRAFWRLWTYADRGGGSIVVAALVALLVLAPFGYAGYLAATRPWLTDIATDPLDPPQLRRASLQRQPGMNALDPYTDTERGLMAEHYPRVTGRRYEAPFGRVNEAVELLIINRGWTIVDRPLAIGTAESSIEIETAATLLNLPVDIAIRLTDEDDTTYVDMRSAWRYGRTDFGDNADRIAAFLAELDIAVAAAAAPPPAADPAGTPDAMEPPVARPEG